MTKIEQYLNGLFYERQREIHALLLGLLAQENVLFVGSFGSAKSLLVRTFASACDMRVFDKLITRTTSESELFGSPEFKALEQGIFKRNGKNMLQEADIFFADEVFKGSSAILNALLSIMNERIYHDGGNVINIPLQFMIGASNEYPTDTDREAELGAMFDRFLFKFDLKGYLRKENLENLLNDMANGKTFATKKIITKTAIQKIRKDVKRVKITSDIIRKLIEIRELLGQKGIVISDRKMVQVIKILPFESVLNNRDIVSEDDLDILTDILWTLPEQRSDVVDIVVAVANPLKSQLIKYYDQINELKKSLPKKGDRINGKEITGADVLSIASNINLQIKEVFADVKKMNDQNNSSEIKELLEYIDKTKKQISKEAMKASGIDF